MNNQPLFTIIIPVVSINDYVRETVSVVQALTGPAWELFVNTNLPEDNPWSQDSRIHVIHSGRVGPADKRDQASRLAQGQYLVFLDDDSYPNGDYLEIAQMAVQETNADLIGGPGITPPTDTLMQKVSGAVFSSKLTGGNPERYLSMGASREIDDWPSVNMIVRTSTFLSVNGFDSPYWPGEDTFLCNKLKRANARMIYYPSLIVWHHRRPGFVRHLKQVGAYGLHRGFFVKRYPTNSLRIRYFIPSLLVTLGSALAAAALVSQAILDFALLSLATYFFLILTSLSITSQRHPWKVRLLAVPYVVASHIVYGFSFIRGLILIRELRSSLRDSVDE